MEITKYGWLTQADSRHGQQPGRILRWWWQPLPCYCHLAPSCPSAVSEHFLSRLLGKGLAETGPVCAEHLSCLEDYPCFLAHERQVFQSPLVKTMDLAASMSTIRTYCCFCPWGYINGNHFFSILYVFYFKFRHIQNMLNKIRKNIFWYMKCLAVTTFCCIFGVVRICWHYFVICV